MNKVPHFSHWLVLPRLRIQNANAVSSPLTHGFPSMTAFLGQMWALERRAAAAGLDWQFNAMGVVSHSHEEQVVKQAYRGAVTSFCLTRNPVDKSGSTAAIVEEGRIHLEVSVVYAIYSDSLLVANKDQTQAQIDLVEDIVNTMRIAGGSVLPRARVRTHRPFVLPWHKDDERHVTLRKFRRRLLPGYFLLSRDDLLEQRLRDMQDANSNATRLDALLSLSRINWRYVPDAEPRDSKETSDWQSDRKGRGWIVPMPVGYGALSEVYSPGEVLNARDSKTPFRFVESLYSVGEWRGVHRLQTPEQILWWADSQPEAGSYRCRNVGLSTSPLSEVAFS